MELYMRLLKLSGVCIERHNKGFAMLGTNNHGRWIGRFFIVVRQCPIVRLSKDWS
jgi:hypothetical protein